MRGSTTATVHSEGTPAATGIVAIVEELEALATRDTPPAAALASGLARLRPLAPGAKARARAVAATRRILEQLDPKGLETSDLAALLHELTPAYLADGTRPILLPFLRSALPFARWSESADPSPAAAAALLGALASLPLDDVTRASAADLVAALSPRLRELLPSMGPEHLAACVQGLRLARGADRAIMLELLSQALRRGIEADGWTPQAVALLCRGLQGIRADPVSTELARDLLAAILPAIAGGARELVGELLTDVLAYLASIPALPSQATGVFLGGLIQHLQGRALRPFELATVIRALGHLELDDPTRTLAASFAQRAVLGHELEELSPQEAADIVLGLGKLGRDSNGAAVTMSFALALSDSIVEAGRHRGARELAELIALLGALPAEKGARQGLRSIAERLLPDVERRAAKFGVEEQRAILASLVALGLDTHATVSSLNRHWAVSAPPRTTPPSPPTSPTAPRPLPPSISPEPGSPGALAPPETAANNGDQAEGDDIVAKTIPGLTGQQVMEKLGVSRTELYRRIKAHGIELPGKAGFSPATLALLKERHPNGQPQSKGKAASEAPRARSSASDAPAADAPAAWISLDDAAEDVGISRSALDGWLKSERELAGKTSREGVRIMLRSDAMPLLRAIRERRMASAPKGLQAAWAARRTKKPSKAKSMPKLPAGRSTPTALPAAPTAAPPAAKEPKRQKTMTGGQAARALGIRRPTL